MIAVENTTDTFRVGYAVINPLCSDKFDKEFGIKIAKGRAGKNKVRVPERLIKTMEFFAERAKRYYKDKKADFTFVRTHDYKK